MSHIIFEGVNRTGKSALISYLKENNLLPNHKMFYDREVRDKYHKKGKGAEAPLDAQLITMIRFLELTDEQYIFDRFHFSEYVYSVIDRGYDCLRAMLEYDKRLAKMDVKVIYMTDSTPSIAERMPCPNNQAYFGNVDRVKMLKQHYNIILKETKLPVMYFNYSNIKNESKCDIDELKEFLGIEN